jgi:hypothetical protein
VTSRIATGRPSAVTWLREGDGLALCFDLARGTTVVTV